jgi:hypothetical protein
MSYHCTTGPAIGPEGRGHLHAVHCVSGPPREPGAPAHTHALGACCPACARGGPCGSQPALSGLLDPATLPLVGLGAALLFVALAWRRRSNPRAYYVYSKEPGARTAEFVHGPYQRTRAQAQATRERRMGLVASVRRKGR